jgi:hypothetical protein
MPVVGGTNGAGANFVQASGEQQMGAAVVMITPIRSLAVQPVFGGQLWDGVDFISRAMRAAFGLAIFGRDA